MNISQKKILLSITNKLTMLGYVFGQEIAADADWMNGKEFAYDLAWQLQELQAELLTVPHQK